MHKEFMAGLKVGENVPQSVEARVWAAKRRNGQHGQYGQHGQHGQYGHGPRGAKRGDGHGHGAANGEADDGQYETKRTNGTPPSLWTRSDDERIFEATDGTSRASKPSCGVL